MSSVTMELANKAAQAGHEVLICHTRDNNTIKESVNRMGNGVKLVSKNQVLNARIIILFVPLDELQNFIFDLPDMTGKILMHTSNAIFGKEFSKSGLKKSSSEIIAHKLPQANIIKIYTIIEQNVFLEKKRNDVKNKIFYSGESIKAKLRVNFFLKTLDYKAIDFDEHYYSS